MIDSIRKAGSGLRSTRRAGLRGIACLLLAATAGTSAMAAPPERPAPPAWAADMVWYQIFPERFHNGDPKNDPTPDDIKGSWPHDAKGEWRVAPWTADWYRLQPWEQANGRGFYYNAQLRRYGGDLQGVIDKLDYLRDLGITAIYLNPIFESPSLHKYDAASYHHVDNNFGPDPEGDRRIWAEEDPADPKTWKFTAADRLFLKLIDEAHRRRMRVIVDGVFNHVGLNFWAFKDARAKGAASKYNDWFYIKRSDDPATPEDEFDYEGWAGVRELPEIREVGDTLAPGPREHIRAIVRRWGDPNGDGNPSDGLDGWRLDVAEKVGHGFWKEFRTWVLEVNPNAYITGEVWWEDWPNNKMFNAEPWLRGDEFDAVMNYRWAAAVKGFFVDRRNALTASEFDRRLGQVRKDYRPESLPALMNLMDSHDTDRLASQVVNPDTLYDHKVGANDDPNYVVRAPRGDELRRLRLVAAFQFAHLGAPMVYYGTEAGMWGGDDPDERKPMVWKGWKYETEASHPFGKARPADPVRFDESLHAHYRTLGRIRARHEALRRGSVETVRADDASRVYAFVRRAPGDTVLAVFNASESKQTIDVPAPGNRLRELLTDRKLKTDGKTLSITLEPLSAALVAVE